MHSPGDGIAHQIGCFIAAYEHGCEPDQAGGVLAVGIFPGDLEFGLDRHNCRDAADYGARVTADFNGIPLELVRFNPLGAGTSSRERGKAVSTLGVRLLMAPESR